jgi:hypothetical protein
MKKILCLAFILLPLFLASQAIVKGGGILYTNGAPVHTVNIATDTEVAIDTSSGLWYERSRDGLGWIASGFRVQSFNASDAPTAAPLDKQSEIVVNNVDSLYRWRSGAWRHINKASTQTITLTGDVTGSGTGTFAATIANSAVTMAKIAQAGATSGQVIKWNGSAWAPAADATGGGGGSFTDLDDVPSSYSGQGGKFVRVNVGATALEFETISGGGDALTANPLSQFAATTSDQLAGVISNETGTGVLVFATSPTLVTPTIGVATATSVNKVAVTPPATSATLTIADGATLTASATATVSGTNTGDQTITLTGDVTGSGTGSFAATIANAAVTMAKIAQAGATSGQVIKWNGSAWAPAADNSSAGASEFIDLNDVPSSYSGQGGKYVAVNSGATALEFVNEPSGGAPSVISPSQITATQNNYSPTGWSTATLVRISGNSGFQKITGFASVTSGAGMQKVLYNVGSFCIYIAPEHTGSDAANRVSFQEEIIIWPGSSAQIFYDNTASRWVVLITPSPAYDVPRRTKYHDAGVARVSSATAMDEDWDLWGSITLSESAPSSTYRFNAWDMATGSTPSGGSGVMYPHDRTTGGARVGMSHIVAKTHIVSPASLSDDTNNYYYFVRLANSPYSGFWNQDNSVGIYYRHSENTGKWFLRSRSAGGTNTEVDSGVTFEVNTEYELQVSLNHAADEATFWINGVVVGRITSNLPSGNEVGWSQQNEKTAGTTNSSFKIYRFIAAAVAP